MTVAASSSSRWRTCCCVVFLMQGNTHLPLQPFKRLRLISSAQQKQPQCHFHSKHQSLTIKTQMMPMHKCSVIKFPSASSFSRELRLELRVQQSPDAGESACAGGLLGSRHGR